MTDEPNALKQKLRSYLLARGHEFIKTGNGYKTRCPNPSHEDSNPSAVMYENRAMPIISCMSGCNFSVNILGVASMITGISDNDSNYKELKNHILETIGQPSIEPIKKNVKPVKKEVVKKSVPITYDSLESFKNEFTHKLFHNRFQFLEKAYNKGEGNIDGEIIGEYHYRNHDLKIILVEVKVIGRNTGKKNVIPFWKNSEDGKITTTNAPYCFYGLERFYENPKRDVMIVSGGECVDSGNRKNGHEFTHITAMGGDNKIDKHDWSFLG